MYEDKKWLLQEPSRELVEYVMKRFDPDPEAGTRLIDKTSPGWPCVISSPNVTGEQLSVSLAWLIGVWQFKAGQPPTFVPSVTEPWHLSDMIRHTFRLAVCGSKDNR